MRNFELTTEQWERIRQLLPSEQAPPRGRPRKDTRTMMNGILYRLQTGISWRELPEEYGPWQSVYGRFRLWKQQGAWRQVFQTLRLLGVLDDSLLPFVPSRKTAKSKAPTSPAAHA